MIRKRVTALVLALASVTLAGCFTTETPLFDASEAAAPPLQPGTYRAREIDQDGTFTDREKTVHIAIDGKTLVIEDPDPDYPGSVNTARFLLTPFEGGTFIAQGQKIDPISGAQEEARDYWIAEPVSNGIRMMAPECMDVRPMEGIDRGEEYCRPKDAASLRAAFTLWRRDVNKGPGALLVRTGD
jgi:hypothetical protein